MPRKPTHALSVLFLLAAFAFAFGCGSGGGGGEAADLPVPRPVSVTESMLASGQHTYKLNCVPCHGPRGRGDGPSAASLDPPPRDHSNREYMARLTDDMIAETVKMGGAIRGYPNMPSSPHIRGDEMIALVAFVRSLSNEKVATVEITVEKFQ